MKNVLILASGNGSNFEAIIKYFKNKKRSDINFKLVSNRKESKVLKRAQKLGIEANFIDFKDLSGFINTRKFDLIAMAGFDRIIDKKTINKTTFINIHPSLLPKYKGLNAIKRAYINNEKETGITIHYANEELDAGEIIYQKKIKISEKWSVRKLENEIHKLEHFYYPRIIERLLGLNVLLIGSGAREHTIAQKVLKSKHIEKLYLADSNDGFSTLGEKIEYSDYIDLSKKAKEKNVNLVIVGAEKYLAYGIQNIFEKEGINIIGPDKNYARLESSKLFAKKIMQKYKIKTSVYKAIKNPIDIDKFLTYFNTPIIKADGLASGKGVYLNNSKTNIKYELQKFLAGKYQEASKTSIIEEKLYGFEVSLFSLWDGENVVHLPLCQDFKQNDKGENTGGLASICPINIGIENNKKLDKYKIKLEEMLRREKIKTPFILYSGLMVCPLDVYVLEFNVRLGDPETQVLLNYINSDILDIFHSIANKMLDYVKISYKEKNQYCVVMTCKGYPHKTRAGIEIKNITNDNIDNLNIYYSNVKIEDEKMFTNGGGRVLSVVSDDKNLIYKTLENIDFEDKEYKKDIKVNII